MIWRMGYEVVCVCDRNPAVRQPFAEVPIFHSEDEFLQWNRAITRSFHLCRVNWWYPWVRSAKCPSLLARAWIETTLPFPRLASELLLEESIARLKAGIRQTDDISTRVPSGRVPTLEHCPKHLNPATLI